MQLFLNIILARAAMIFSILLTVILLLRVCRQARPETWMGRTLAPLFRHLAPFDKWLRQIHIPLGIALLAAGLVHGLLSSESVLSANLGTAAFILSVLLALSFMFRKKLKKYGWMSWHRGLTYLFVLALAFHLVNVGGFMPNVAETAFFSDMTGQYASVQVTQQGDSVPSATGGGTDTETNSGVAGNESDDASGGTPDANTGDIEAPGTASAWLAGLPDGLPADASGDAFSQNPTDPAAAAPEAVATPDSTPSAATADPTPAAKPDPTPSAATADPTPAAKPDPTPEAAAPASVQPVTVKYKDGVYTGSARGYGPNLTVEVTVMDGLIADIRIVSHNERGERYYLRPMQLISQAIIQSQATDVDAISGATRTSNGIMEAVAAALEQAGT